MPVISMFYGLIIAMYYEVLNDRSYCRKAKVLNGTVVWDALTDFDPDRLYLESKRLLITK